MRNLSKRAISILVIVTFLMSMIPIMPALALTLVVSGDDAADSFITLTATGTSAAVWDSTFPVGGSSVKLSAAAGTSDYAAIVLDTDLTFEDIEELSLYYYVETASVGGVHICYYLTDGTYIAEITFYQPIAYTADTWTEMVFDADVDPAASGYFYFGNAPEAVGEISGPGWAGAPATLPALSYWQALLGDYTVDRVQVEYGWFDTGTADAWIDNMTLNGAFYQLDETGADYDDTLTISGTDVTAGSTVNVYWDYVNAAGLLNNTVGNPDGTYDLELDVPSGVGGYHYVWIKDVDTGDTMMWPDPISVVPRLKVSPTSGLIDDEITLSGYGFQAEQDLSFTFDGADLTTSPTSVDTDEDGYFTATFDVPNLGDLADYLVVATDGLGWTGTAEFDIGASIALDPEEGPTGTIVTVDGRGWTPTTSTMTFNIEGTPVRVVDGDTITVGSDGEFTADVIIPNMGDVDEYEITAVESGPKDDAGEDFDITGIPEIVVDPTYGAPGATITVTGSNFTQISGTEVTVELWDAGTTDWVADLDVVDTESDGTFTTTFISPAVTFTTYDVGAVDEELLDATDAFKVGLIALIINPISGESGTEIAITGIGFANGVYNLTFGDESVEEDYGTVASNAIADAYYAPNVVPGIYTLTIIDTDENELSVLYTVTESTTASVDPALAPNDYNVTIEGNNFADAVADVGFVIYNSTEEWDMLVQTSTGPGPAVDDTATDSDGNFTGWWEVEAELSNGDYTINVTGGEGLLVQLDFSVVSARVSATPRKALFDRGDTVSFDISNDFVLGNSYIEIYTPDETLAWITDLFGTALWVEVEDLQTIPYYRQTANANPMELASDAPLGTWMYFFYDNADDELMNSTFEVGASTAAQVDELLDDVRDDISALAGDLAGITDDVEADIAALSGEIGDVATDMAALKDDIVSDLANDIADATDAAAAAVDAVGDLADSMTDLGDAVGDIADTADSAADAAAAAADAANDAVTAAEAASDSAGGLTTLVYGAIGASLIAALAAIVSLMQISRRIAG